MRLLLALLCREEEVKCKNFSQVAESNCVMLFLHLGALAVDWEGFRHGDIGESPPASLSLY